MDRWILRVSDAIRVLLIEDHELLAESLRIALASRLVPAQVAPLNSHSALLALVESTRPELVLLDLDLGAQFTSGFSLISPITALGAQVLVVTGERDLGRIAATIDLGAVGYFHKSQPFDDLVAGVILLLDGGSVLSSKDRFELISLARRHRLAQATVRAPFGRLTTREQQVLRALADGQTVDSIAAAWVVSPATVRTQVRGILTKLGVGTQLAAVAQARRSGWLAEAPRP